jgi:hydrogenase nickel incorporation protein HypB
MAIRTIAVRERILARNDALAAEVRRRLLEHGVPAFNLVSSPGSGKTTLLERTLDTLGRDLRIAVVTGDVQTHNDADRLAQRTARLVQAVETGGACHLDASQVAEALQAIELESTDLLFVENVGNLVCPANWDLGETAKIVLFAVTEGEDKPVKYPSLFKAARYVVFSKADLLPYVPFDLERALGYLEQVNPAAEVFVLSALTGRGLDRWFDFLRSQVRSKVAA